jgi:hypothetical protein
MSNKNKSCIQALVTRRTVGAATATAATARPSPSNIAGRTTFTENGYYPPGLPFTPGAGKRLFVIINPAKFLKLMATPTTIFIDGHFKTSLTFLSPQNK